MVKITRELQVKYYRHLVSIQHDCDGKQSGIVTESDTVCGIALFLTCSLTENIINHNFKGIKATLKPHS